MLVGGLPQVPFNVISWDGGPGCSLHLRLIRRIEQERPGFLGQATLLAGSSDGSFVALFLADRLESGHAPLQALEEAITFTDELATSFRFSLADVMRFTTGRGAMLANAPLRAILERNLSNRKLRDLTRTKVLVVSFDMDRLQPRISTNLDIPESDSVLTSGLDWTLSELVMASCAMPLSLPLFLAADGTRSADGGVVAGNPAMCALSAAMASLRGQHPEVPANELMGRIRLLSLGTSPAEEDVDPRQLPALWLEAQVRRLLPRWGLPTGLQAVLSAAPSRTDWGWLDWLIRRPAFLSYVMMMGSIGAVDYQTGQLLEAHQYLRLAPPVPTMRLLASALTRGAPEIIGALDQHAAALIDGPGRGELGAWLETAGWLASAEPRPGARKR